MICYSMSFSYLYLRPLSPNKGVRRIYRICSFQGTLGLSGLEPPTSRLSGVRSNQLSYKPSYCPMAAPSGDGDKEIRTLDPLLARQVLSQLSYIPIFILAATYSPTRMQYHRPAGS